MNFFAIGYIVRDPFVKPSMRVVVVRAKCREAAVGFVMSKLRQFYKHFDVFIDDGYVEVARIKLECPKGHVFVHDLEYYDGYFQSMSVCCPHCARLVHCCILGVSYVQVSRKD